VEGSFIRYIPL